MKYNGIKFIEYVINAFLNKRKSHYSTANDRFYYIMSSINNVYGVQVFSIENKHNMYNTITKYRYLNIIWFVKKSFIIQKRMHVSK